MSANLSNKPRLYPRAPQQRERLNARNLNYQFDEEKDICWDRIDEPGDIFGRAFCDLYEIDQDKLREHGAHELFQWCVGVASCDMVIALERVAMRFMPEVREHEDPRLDQSLFLLEDEERKHQRIFERYGKHLRSQHPKWAALIEEDCRAFDDAVMRTYEDSGIFTSPAAFHYVTWLGVLFFEEFTVYLDQTLRENVDPVQPTWMALHLAHCQEERQHVLTDYAWLEALDLSQDERYGWSRWAYLAQRFGIQFPVQTAKRLCSKFYPGSEEAFGTPSQSKVLLGLLQHRPFARTLKSAPYLRELVANGGKPSTQGQVSFGAGSQQEGLPAGALRSASQEDIESWLRTHVTTHLQVDTELVQNDVSPLDLGLDSVQAVLLVGELGDASGLDLSPSLVYEKKSITAIASHIVELHRALGADSSDDGGSSKTLDPGTTGLRWLENLRACESPRARIFLFPRSAGTAANFLDWPELLPEGVELWMVQSPGWGRRLDEKSLTQMSELVEALIPALTPRLDKPFIFYGHSIGAATAFAVATHLESTGSPTPFHLVLAGRRAPGSDEALPITHTLPDDAFMEALGRYGGVSQSMVEEGATRAPLLAAMRADAQLVETWDCGAITSIPVPITAWSGTQDPIATEERMQPWSRRTSAGFAFEKFDGDHFFPASYSAEVVQRLSKIINDEAVANE